MAEVTLTYKKFSYTGSLQRAMGLWRQHSERYRTLKDEYEELLKQKRELNLALNAMTEAEVESYPEIEFLKIENEKDAEEYLLDMNPRQIEALAYEVEETVKFNYTYNTMISKVKDFRFQIKAKTEPKKVWCFFPTKPTSSARCKRTAPQKNSLDDNINYPIEE